jgi:hypothetical protein
VSTYVRRGEREPLVLVHRIASRWQMRRPVPDRLAASVSALAARLGLERVRAAVRERAYGVAVLTASRRLAGLLAGVLLAGSAPA